MTELKRPERYIQFESIKPELKEITEFYTRKVSDYQYRMKMLNEYADSLENEISVLKEKPKPIVEVPQFVADYIETQNGNDYDGNGYLILNHYNSFKGDGNDSELDMWIANNFNDFLNAIVNGYTVKKEQFYVLEFPNRKNPYVACVKSNMITQQCSQIEDAKRFTETEIKAIDERYMAFAVKVEEN